MPELASDPIIIFGAPRSGTTYLRAIIDQHPLATITHETRIFVWLHRVLRELPENPQVLRVHPIPVLDAVEEHLPELVRNVYRKLAPDAKWWGDKNPHYASDRNIAAMETAASLFPNARFLHIVRDGREVAASLARKKFPDGRPWASFEEAHRVWASHVRNGQHFGSGMSSDRYLEIRYEDLVADGVTSAAAIYSFLQIPESETVMRWVERQDTSRTPLSEPTRDLSMGASVSAWATVFNADEQRRSMELIEADLVALGYE